MQIFDDAAFDDNAFDDAAFDDSGLTAIDPRYIPATRIKYALLMLFPIVGGVMLEYSIGGYPGAFLIPLFAVAAFIILRVPGRKYRQWGYHMAPGHIRIISGYLFNSDTIVPFGRIQHIDVDQGPIQRRYGLATLTLHTAGNHNSSVHLPGLAHDDALALRELIRAHIKRDML